MASEGGVGEVVKLSAQGRWQLTSGDGVWGEGTSV